MDIRVTGWEGVDLDATVSGWGPLAGPCEHSNESSGSIQCGKFD